MDTGSDLVGRLRTVEAAAEMLWVVLANVSGGDWKQQSEEWQEAAARWRDNYFAALRPLLQEMPASEYPPLPEKLVKRAAETGHEEAAEWLRMVLEDMDGYRTSMKASVVKAILHFESASLRLSETTQRTNEDDVTRSGEPVTAPSDVHAANDEAKS
jgi:hypothetical protein